MPDNPVVLPGWFVRVFAAVAGLAVPYAIWSTSTLWTIAVQMDAVNRGQVKREILAERFQEHLSDPGPHASAMAPITYRLQAMERRLDAIEKRP